MESKSIAAKPKLSRAERRPMALYRLFMFGVFLIVVFFYLSWEGLTVTKSNLVKLEGSISYSDIFIENVSVKGRLGTESRSRKASLIFWLKGYNKQFIIHENIGQQFRHPVYNRLLNSLKASESVSVHIKKSSLSDFQPKVFQIDADGETLLDFQSVKSEYFGVSIVVLIFGLIIIIYSLYQKFPIQMKVIIGIGEKNTK